MSGVKEERDVNRPAGTNAKYEINPFYFAPGKEQKEFTTTSDDKKNKKAQRILEPLSTELGTNMVIEAYSNEEQERAEGTEHGE